jgi:hypothetical protein
MGSRQESRSVCCGLYYPQAAGSRVGSLVALRAAGMYRIKLDIL